MIKIKKEKLNAFSDVKKKNKKKLHDIFHDKTFLYKNYILKMFMIMDNVIYICCSLATIHGWSYPAL